MSARASGVMFEIPIGQQRHSCLCYDCNTTSEVRLTSLPILCLAGRAKDASANAGADLTEEKKSHHFY